MHANDWSDCHALLEMALDTIEERCSGWFERWTELMTIAPFTKEYPPARWATAVSPFAKEMHQALDGALRCDGDERLHRLAWICKALECGDVLYNGTVSDKVAASEMDELG